MKSKKVTSRTLSHSGFLSFVSEKELVKNLGFSQQLFYLINFTRISIENFNDILIGIAII